MDQCEQWDWQAGEQPAAAEALTSQVQRTQRALRDQQLRTVFNEFDGQLMKLDAGKRRDKYAKMMQSPFSFFRGSAYLFYYDTAREWLPYHTSPERPTWIQGDLHFENFGAFRNASGRLVYDVNDFDEGYLGSYLYDLLRMSVSVSLVCRMKGFEEAERLALGEAYLRAYYRQIRRFAKGKDDPADYAMDESQASGPIRKLLKKLKKREGMHYLEKVTARMRGTRQFEASEEIVPAAAEEREAILAAWPAYVEGLAEHLRGLAGIKDIAVKHGSGTASIGLDRYYVLAEGGGGEQELDDIVLEMKEVRVPVPAYFLPYNEAFWAAFGHQGKRVMATQRAMHHEADPYLGYLTLDGRDYYIRERSPYKKRLKLDAISDAAELAKVLDAMGRLTAKMHARADADVEHGVLAYHSEAEILRAMGEDEAAFCAFVAGWANGYAEQVELDYELFQSWAKRRRKG
jgi:uncharacterized protein (DUF2252 family)